MSFPLYYILCAYLFFLFIWLIFSIVGVFHILKFGFINFLTFSSVFFYIAISLIMLVVSYNLIIGIDWGINITILNGIFDFNFNNFPK